MPETSTSALRKLFGGLAALFKDTPDAGDVHVDVPLGGKKKPKDGVEKDGGFIKSGDIASVDVDHGLVLGFAIVCKKDGADYFDLQGDHIPEDTMLSASLDFMHNSRMAKEMHAGDQNGSVVFALPITADVRKYIVEHDTTGLFIGMAPGSDMLAKFKSGDLRGFSIGGRRGHDEEVE